MPTAGDPVSIKSLHREPNEHAGYSYPLLSFLAYPYKTPSPIPVHIFTKTSSTGPIAGGSLGPQPTANTAETSTKTEKTSTPSGDTGNRNKGTTSSTENKDKPSGSLKVPPNFVLSKKILKKIEHRMEYVKKQESLPPAPTPLRQAAVRAALNGVVPHLKPAHREAKAQKGKTSKSDDDFNTAAQTIQPACQPQNNPEPASKPDKPPGTLAAPVPNNFSFSLGTTTPSAQTQKEKPSKTQPQAQTKAAPEAQGAGSTPSGGTTSGTGKPAGTGSSSRLTFSPYSVCGRFQAARLRLKQMREDRSRAQPAEGSREDRSRAQPAEGSREDRSRAQPAEGSREDRSRAQPAEGSREDRSRAQPAEGSREDRSRAQPADGSREDRSRAQPEDGSRENQLSTELLRASPRAPAQPLTPTPASAPPRPLTPTPASAPPRPLTPTPALSRYRGPITTKQGQKLSRGQAEARATTESNKQPEPKPSTEEASGFTMTHYTDWHLSNAQWPMFDEATQLMERFQKYSNEFHYPDGFSTFSMSTTLGSKVTLREVDDPTEVDTAFEEWYSGMNPFTPKTTNPSTATTTTNPSTATTAAIPTTQLLQASDHKPPADPTAPKVSNPPASPPRSRKKQKQAVSQSKNKEEEMEDIPPASPLSPNCPPRPSGRWHPFMVDKFCSRHARCQHRATNSALPPNVTKWLNVSRNYLCEPPWVTTATLAASLALRERGETHQ
ncbi:hypothetical protein J4Q44_G00340260 [Coregonus suidteri]|uniref:Uncharacterized protein n=1 Tax=Coregonus suidteri TaxID=861788 RepID=A0AAN8QH19_9TELE